jgi:hypothetical protein
MTREKLVTAMVLATLGVCLLYEAYRYPFQISSTTTSPDYADTPLGLQMGKYVLLGAIALVLLLLARLPPALPDKLLALACGWLLYRSLAAVTATGEATTFDVTAPFVFGGLIAVFVPGRIGRLAYPAAALTVAVHAAMSVVQIVLWATTGRLPALSQPDDAIKRFGGLWDDPNAVGVFSALVLVYLVAERRYEWWLIGLASFNVVVSLSYSAAAALVVGLWVVLLSRRRAVAFALVPAIAAAAVAVFVLPFHLVPVAGDWLDTKQESARLRLDEATLPGPDNWLFGSNVPDHSENSTAALVNASGLVGLGLVVAWLVVCVRWTPPETRTWFVPVLAGFLVASQLVPYIGVFPLGTLFPLLVSQVARRPVPEREVSPAGPEPSRREDELVVGIEPRAARGPG